MSGLDDLSKTLIDFIKLNEKQLKLDGDILKSDPIGLILYSLLLLGLKIDRIENEIGKIDVDVSNINGISSLDDIKDKVDEIDVSNIEGLYSLDDIRQEINNIKDDLDDIKQALEGIKE